MKKLLLFTLFMLSLAFLSGCGAKSEPDPVIKLNPKIDYASINPDTDLLLVKDSNGKYGFIDIKGNIAIPLQYELAMPFSDGLANIVTKQYHGYIDKTGKLVLKNHYHAVWPFINGHAVFISKDGDDYRYGIIDKNGTVVVQPIYPFLHLESDGMIAFRDTSNKWGYMNSDCSVVIPAQYTGADDFYSGKAIVQTSQDGKLVYIDKLGRPTGDSVPGDFSPGFQLFIGNRDISGLEMDDALSKLTPKARDIVSDCQYCGQGLYSGVSATGCALMVFDKDGNVKFKSLGFQAGLIGEGLCAIDQGGGVWGYVDMTGKQVIENSIIADNAGMFVNGIARLDTGLVLLNALDWSDESKIEGSKDSIKISYIDKTGKYIWKQPEHFKLDINLNIDGNSALFCIVVFTIIFFFFFSARRCIKRWYAAASETMYTDWTVPAPQNDEEEQEFKE